jgi:hypothetical protein
VTIFGVPWEELDLEHVQRFLASAGREPLTWEAKGTELRPEHVTRHVCGFANAVDGGYLLLGFDLVEEDWRATGWAFPGDDPPVWVSNIVRTTLDPRPRIDVRDWSVSDSKRAAIVHVEPVAEPPCVTSGGQLYERVSGETIPVADAADVRALYDRGRAAAAQAEAVALRALGAAVPSISFSGPNIPLSLVLVLVVAPVGTARDISARVFTPSVAARLREIVDGLPKEPVFSEDWQMERTVETRMTQDAIVVETTSELEHVWRLRAAWDGSVAGLLRANAVSDRGSETLPADELFNDAVRPLALAVEQAARGIGGYGRAHVVMAPVAYSFSLRHAGRTRPIPHPKALRQLQRWADGERWLDDHVIDSMKRELLRACGFLEWEPGG